jgi:hypothetical protein
MSESAQVYHWQESCHQPDKENSEANHAYDLMYPSFDEQSADPIGDRQDNRKISKPMKGASIELFYFFLTNITRLS